MNPMRDRGIGTQVHFIPVHRQPYTRRRYGELDLPVADRHTRRRLSLPLFPHVNDRDD